MLLKNSDNILRYYQNILIVAHTRFKNQSHCNIWKCIFKLRLDVYGHNKNVIMG